jgi:hypothetical protein
MVCSGAAMHCGENKKRQQGCWRYSLRRNTHAIIYQGLAFSSTKISDYLSSTEEGFESGLRKVVIVSQGGLDAFGFHDLETGAVGEAPVLVSAPSVKLKRPCELLRGLANHDYSVAFARVFDSLNRDRSHAWAAVTKRVQQFG